MSPSSANSFSFLFAYLNFKLRPGTRVITTGYPVTKTGYAANHRLVLLNEQSTVQNSKGT